MKEYYYEKNLKHFKSIAFGVQTKKTPLATRFSSI